ncbi:MAG TPA: ABC transporter permease [Planctomycetota bacterium]|nr:ABC transporter permease [Planctomycetota bacterium]
MRVLLVTLKKELMSYFFSPVAYVIAVLFYLFRGFEISRLAWTYEQFPRAVDGFTTGYVFVASTNFMIVLVPPILTMRCFAEEKRTGSLEVLLTAPVRDVEIVLGKWLAALGLFAALWLPTALLLWVLTWPSFLNGPLPVGPAFASYVGLTMLGAMLLAVGCFTSSLTDNQLLASLSAMLFNIALLAVPNLAQQRFADVAEENHTVRVLLEQVNVFDHLQNWFTRGLIDTSHLVFYASGAAFFLFLTVKSLESRKWR